ncbi:unnamed protein product [Sphagnum balticum]
MLLRVERGGSERPSSATESDGRWGEVEILWVEGEDRFVAGEEETEAVHKAVNQFNFHRSLPRPNFRGSGYERVILLLAAPQGSRGYGRRAGFRGPLLPPRKEKRRSLFQEGRPLFPRALSDAASDPVSPVVRGRVWMRVWRGTGMHGVRREEEDKGQRASCAFSGVCARVQVGETGAV